MGNKTSKPPTPKEEASLPPVPTFQPLTSGQRAVTFDTRVLSTGKVHMLNAEFKPLKRAMTYDSRMHQRNPLATVQDILYRRHFNVKEQRDSTTQTLHRISESIEDVRDGEVVVVVDPMTTGMKLAEEVLRRGYGCVSVYSDTLVSIKDLVKDIPQELRDQFLASLFHDGSRPMEESIGDTLTAIKQLNVNIVAVLPGAETGVMLADMLSERLNVVTNGTSGSLARRNKYAMGEKIRAAGLRAVKQCSATTWGEVEAFIEQDLKPDPFRVIIKPEESAGSDDVFLCTSMEEVKKAFGSIQGKINHLGLENTSTLVQEYLHGTEYVVDTVSRNGTHKVVAVWEYDKRPANDAPFVYFGVKLRPAGETIEAQVVDYILQVLDALEIKHGPAHAEVKYVNGEPCLVEIGSRCHGGAGTFMPLVDKCIGYNQVGVTCDAYFDEDAFHELADRPLTLNNYCIEVTLVSYKDAILNAYPGLPEIEQLPSFVSKKINVQPGEHCPKTIDMFNFPGSIMLIHESEEQLLQDAKRIRELEQDGLYEYAPPVDVSEPQAIVVVDPFSTGALVAEDVTKRGYSCICVYSDSLENIEAVANLIPEGVELSFAATVGYEGTVDKTIEALKQAVKQLGANLVAVVPGAETGVRLCDEMTHAMGLRGNLIEHCDARRDKYEMGETLRRAGVRAVLQTKATSWEQARSFIEEMNPTPFKVILKPLESAGSDGVTLCFTMEECEKTFNELLGKVNGVGLVNTAVLVQEYLEGTEYVVDTVSRDGEHKVIAIWQYDKRPVNNAAFVYFGVESIPAQGIINELITYQFSVLDALGIQNGPGHAELKYFKNEPVLVEVGARCHGGEGTWVPIANRCNGYNQVSAFIDAYTDLERFNNYPEKPTKLLEYGYEAKIVCYKDGNLRSIPGVEKVKNLASYIRHEMFVKAGAPIKKTIDVFTTPGTVILIHPDEKQLREDMECIRGLEHEGFFDIDAQEE